MSEATAKPYLVRALYEWCADQGLTPYLAVKVSDKTRVPMAYVRNGEITLNISETATQKLTMDNDWILFNARFNGASQEVAVPIANVLGIYARETGYGMGFTIPEALTPEASTLDGAPPATEPALTLAPAVKSGTPTADTSASTSDALEGRSPTDPPSTLNESAADVSPKPSRSRSHLSVVK